MHAKVTWASEARRLKAAGLTYREIGEKMGVSRQRVQQVIVTDKRSRNGFCEKCQKFSTVLHCHHTDYISDDFQILCPSCHKKQHPKPCIDLNSKDYIEKTKANMTKGEQVKKWRTQAGMSLRRLAKEMGFSAPFVSDLELGRRNWTVETFDKAFRILNGGSK